VNQSLKIKRVNAGKQIELGDHNPLIVKEL